MATTQSLENRRNVSRNSQPIDAAAAAAAVAVKENGKARIAEELRKRARTLEAALPRATSRRQFLPLTQEHPETKSIVGHGF